MKLDKDTKNSLNSTRIQKNNRIFRPEYGTLIMLVLAIILGSVLSPYFRDLYFVFDSTSLYVEYGIVALMLTLVIISGQIDLSVASTMAFVGCFTAFMYEQGMHFIPAIFVGLCVGTAFGLFNGWIITYFELPSIIVTIGTLSLFRGMAQVLLGDHSIGHFPDWFVGIDFQYLWFIPVPFLIFLGLFIVMTVLLNKTIFGRHIFAIGTNEKAARYSGIPVKRIKMILFGLSGTFAAAGGIMMISRLGVARYNLAAGGELDVVTIALLGGTDINGGRGNVVGTFIAFLVLVSLKTGMSVANIKIENQLTVLGFLLIFAIVLSNYIYGKRQ